MKTNTVIKGDCLEIMKQIPDESIDLILCDLPYGATRNKWDAVIDLERLWQEYERIIKERGTIVLTAVQLFASQLIMKRPHLFKYDLVWKKTISSGQLNVNVMPLRNHEHILVFYKKFGTYNQQFTNGKPYSINRKVTYKGESYNPQVNTSKRNNGYRHPTSVIEIQNPRIKNGHPTQKPLKLFEYLVKTYSKENDLVLDNCIGSGTTAIACIKQNRKYIGIELKEKYYQMCLNNIKKMRNIIKTADSQNR